VQLGRTTLPGGGDRLGGGGRQPVQPDPQELRRSLVATAVPSPIGTVGGFRLRQDGPGLPHDLCHKVLRYAGPGFVNA
jgi:hypothetical protein